MFSITSISLALVAILPSSLVLGSPVLTCLYGPCSTASRGLPPSQIASQLGPQLSNTSRIFGPDDTDWTNATLRFQGLSHPDIQVVVQPGEESDVATIVSLEANW